MERGGLILALLLCSRAEEQCGGQPPQKPLLFGADNALADRICCHNHRFAEPWGYFGTKRFFQGLLAAGTADAAPHVFYDSVCGKPLFVAPRKRSFAQWRRESEAHGWPSFRPEELVAGNVIIHAGGRMESVCGTHLGHNLPSLGRDRYCIDLVCIAGRRALGAAPLDVASFRGSAARLSGKAPPGWLVGTPAPSPSPSPSPSPATAAPASLAPLASALVPPVPGTRRARAAPASAANDPSRSVWLGQGCFWHTQFDVFALERRADGPFRRLADTKITALAGYAGGLWERSDGSVCYHGNGDAADYGALGHAEAVSVELDLDLGAHVATAAAVASRAGRSGAGAGRARAAAVARALGQWEALLAHYFDQGFQAGRGGGGGGGSGGSARSAGLPLRLDPQDGGAQYRNVIGLPGGLDNALLAPALRAAALRSGLPLRRGRGGPDHDRRGEGVVYVYDSRAFPFFRAEKYHQFHANVVMRRPVPATYTGRLARVQSKLGRLTSTGCTGVPPWMS